MGVVTQKPNSVVRITPLQAFVLQLLVVYCDLKDYNLVFSIQRVYSTQDGGHICTWAHFCWQTKSYLTSCSLLVAQTCLFVAV